MHFYPRFVSPENAVLRFLVSRTSLLGREGAVTSDKDRGAALCSLASSVYFHLAWNKHETTFLVFFLAVINLDKLS
jgi:hypothetical protein